ASSPTSFNRVSGSGGIAASPVRALGSANRASMLKSDSLAILLGIIFGGSDDQISLNHGSAYLSPLVVKVSTRQLKDKSQRLPLNEFLFS
ncbi:MAG: hypothetical protein EZS28_043470, partial [Streblomastix strix]